MTSASRSKLEVAGEFENRLNVLLEDSKIRQLKTEYSSNGYALINDLFSPEFCNELISVIDGLESTDATFEGAKASEVHYGGSELRFWMVHLKHELLNGFKLFSDRIASSMFDKPMEAHDILAIRNNEIDTAEVSLTKGRWHVDSYFEQFKTFLFLTQTTEESGPFEFLPGTQKPSFKFKSLIKGKYITPGDLLSGDRRYKSLNDEWVEGLFDRYPTKPVICNPGTLVLMNTSAVHRARPCFSGHRYALTSYYM